MFRATAIIRSLHAASTAGALSLSAAPSSPDPAEKEPDGPILGPQHATESEIKHHKTLKDSKPIEIVPKLGKGKLCDWISTEPGNIFDNSDARLIQSFTFYGNPQWQYSYVSGTDATGKRFSGDEFLLRRFKLGMRIHFFQYFTSSVSSDMLDDGEPRKNNDYDSFEYALYTSDVIFDAQDAFNWDSFDQFQFRLGYFRIPSNAEWAQSSNSMRTIERSSLSNYASPLHSMGLMVSTRHGRWDVDLGLFSSDDINSGRNADPGSFWIGHLGYMFGAWHEMDSVRGDLRIVINNDPSKGETFRQDWVVSASTTMKKKHWRLSADFILGANGDSEPRGQRGNYLGINVVPSLWLIEEKLEAVFRYQYAKAQQPNGFRISAHSIRRIANAQDAFINNGYGDKHHSAYAGINYYLCGDNTKIMAGLQWDDLSSRNKQVFTGLTTWVAFRLYF